ncbi:tetratricopeptide repeat protein [Nonomuraea jiangxiensis]|uniref:Tetratricopeptide repeat-containing protein n=1 Tax=Nonomuraea jiangxiensis TaxID=633440 RepID=A0A1G8EUT3_9ACTN|nr:tetratricopeptide repeat protein [Nonomuraea jiangxiensis]SDH73605.1 Tetratricopeptide repeat-containing protein [Nonomuraea jiangxiensis]
MDTPPHHLGLERVVEVYSGHDDLVGVTGSGYVIGADLVLSSGHVVDPGAPCQVRLPSSARWTAAEEVWRGRGEAGAVLLRVADAPWGDVPGIEHVRWARVSGVGYRLRCVARGFPMAGRRTGARAAQTVVGLVEAPSGAVSKALTVNVLTPEPATTPVALWQGLSGAVLLAEPAGQLIGVITQGHHRDTGDFRDSGDSQGLGDLGDRRDGEDDAGDSRSQRDSSGWELRSDRDERGAGWRLDVVPVTALLGDERFRALAGVAPGRLETVAEGDPVVMLPGLLSPAHIGLPPDRPDWTLLMARHAVVPFLGRDEELAALRAWIAEPAALSIAVMTGRSGTGKTRLAAELCAELAQAGWDTGTLPLSSVTGPLTSRPDAPNRPMTRVTRLDARRPALLVVDHPEPSAPLVGELIRRLAKHDRNPPVRLLLVAREPGDPEWWRRLDTASGGWLRRLNSTTVHLNAHPLTLAERNRHAFAAMKAFAPSRAVLPPPPRLDDPEYGLPVRVHLAALLRLRDGTEGDGEGPENDHELPPSHAAPSSPASGDAGRHADEDEDEANTEPLPRLGGGADVGDGLLSRFLARERRQWARVWPDGHDRVDDMTALQAVAVLTLTAPTPAELPGLLTTVPGVRDLGTPVPGVRDLGTGELPDHALSTGGLPDRALRLAAWLGRIFPGGERLVPLGPDLIAEQLLDETDGLEALVLALHDHEGRTVEHLIRMLDVLRLSAGRARVRAALRSLVAARIGRLVAESAAAPATRLGDVLNAALGLFPADRELAEAVSARLERDARPLDEPGSPTRNLSLDMLDANPEVLDPNREVLDPSLEMLDPTPEVLDPNPGVLNPDLGVLDPAAGELGLRALGVTLGESVVRRRRAAGAGAGLARALAVLAGRLAAVGRVVEAVVVAKEAVEILAAAPPYEEAAGRAEALFQLAGCLLLAGEPAAALKPAQEAAARYRILAEDGPGHAGEVARAHYNLACALLEVDRLDEAVAAFELAGGDPELAANLTGALSVLPPPATPTGPPEANRSPSHTAYEPPLGTAYERSPEKRSGAAAGGWFAEGATDAGPESPAVPPEVSVWPAPEPLPLYAEVNADVLAELGAGLAVAVTTAVKDAAPTSRDVALRLHLLAAWLHGRERAADALVPAVEAVGRLRGLADAEPELRYLLATAAGLRSRIHAGLDDLDAAVRSAGEAARNLRALVTLEPGTYRPLLAGQLLDLGELLLIDDRAEDALHPLQEAMGVVAEGHVATQARARWLLGLCLDEIGRPMDALAQLEIAAELYDLPGAEGDDHPRRRSEVRARLSRLRSALDADIRAYGVPGTRESPFPAPEPTRAGEPPLAAPEPARTGGMRPFVSGAAGAVRAAGVRPWMLALVSERPAEEGVRRAERLLAERRRIVESAGTPEAEEVHAHLSAQATLARAWADAGRAADGFVLAMQAAESLRHTAVPDRPHAIAVGMVAAALGRTLVALGRYKEAIPHLLTAIEAYEPQTGTSPAFRRELAELMVLETVALSHATCPSDAESAAERLVELYGGLVADRLQPPVALAGALRLLAGIRYGRRNVEGALESVTRALDVIPAEPDGHPPAGEVQVLTATCLELAGLCLAELDDGEAAGAKLAEGTALLEQHGPVPPDLVTVHLLALIRLARLRVAGEGPAAGVAPHARLLGIRPLPEADVLHVLIEELSGGLGDMSGADPAGLVPSLTSFTDALERQAPPSSEPGLHDKYARCLARFGDAAARAGDRASAVQVAELAVRVYRGLVAVSGRYRERLGTALATLARLRETPPLPALEQAIDLLGSIEGASPAGGALVEMLLSYAGRLHEQGRHVEALAHCERAADLCDELDDPAVAALTYARLGEVLAALDRPRAALEAITWSLAELERAEQAGRELPHVRARAVQVRGRVLRASGREQEALAHLVEAVGLFTRLPDPRAAAETAALVADDLLAGGRPEEAAEYARLAATGHPPDTVKHALATQRLARCHMMLGALAEAHALVEDLIPRARRRPDDLTYRAILADSLAQSSELLPALRPDGAAEAEARAREAIAIYDELLTTGMNAQALHTSRAGACLTLAAALRMRDQAAEAVQPLREAVAALERFASGNRLQAGLLSRAMLMLGDALMEAGRALEAGFVFHRGTQVTRDEVSRAVAHARLGFCQQELGRDDAADAALRVSADLLRGLAPRETELTGLLQDVLRGRLRLLEKAGGDGAAKAAVEQELRRLTSHR